MTIYLKRLRIPARRTLQGFRSWRPLWAVMSLAALGLLACTQGGVQQANEPATPPVVVTTQTTQASPTPIQAPATSTLVTPEPTETVEPQTVASSIYAPTGEEKSAPELGDTANFINSEPFSLKEQQDNGRVVLIDFWTYTCVNCIRTMPFLRQWHAKYADKGLVILGVHTPEFEFEKVTDNVLDAIQEFGIEWPVVQDNEFETWRAFDNRFWPAKYLIDSKGTIRYMHFGEGSYDETEGWIRAMLEEAGHDLSDVTASTYPGPDIHENAKTAASGLGTTRELYGGFKRNFSALVSQSQPPYVLHEEYYENQGTEILYVDPGDHKNHFIYLQGLWRNNAENLVHARTTLNMEDYIAIKFFATSVNAVLSPEKTESYDVSLTIDGGPIPRDQAGLDVQFDEDGNSFVHVDGARMYFIISQPEFSGHELRLSSDSDDFSLFAFTFGSYENGEVNPDEEPESS